MSCDSTTCSNNCYWTRKYPFQPRRCRNRHCQIFKNRQPKKNKIRLKLPFIPKIPNFCPYREWSCIRISQRISQRISLQNSHFDEILEFWSSPSVPGGFWGRRTRIRGQKNSAVYLGLRTSRLKQQPRELTQNINQSCQEWWVRRFWGRWLQIWIRKFSLRRPGVSAIWSKQHPSE